MRQRRQGYHNQRIVEYHKTTSLAASSDEVPWCSSFVNWVLEQNNCRGTNSALAKSWLTWAASLPTARVDAVTVIKRKGATSDAATGSSTGYHVAFYVSATPTHVRLLGGNAVMRRAVGPVGADVTASRTVARGEYTVTRFDDSPDGASPGHRSWRRTCQATIADGDALVLKSAPR